MTGITDKIKEKVKGAKDKVVDTAEKATDTTKKSISSSTSTTNNQEIRQRILLRNMTKKNQCLQLK